MTTKIEITPLMREFNRLVEQADTALVGHAEEVTNVHALASLCHLAGLTRLASDLHRAAYYVERPHDDLTIEPTPA